MRQKDIYGVGVEPIPDVLSRDEDKSLEPVKVRNYDDLEAAVGKRVLVYNEHSSRGVSMLVGKEKDSDTKYIFTSENPQLRLVGTNPQINRDGSVTATRNSFENKLNYGADI